MKKLLFTDPHIIESSINELNIIFTEIISYKADELLMLGDYYDKNRPSAKELEFGTRWAKNFVNGFKKVIFLKGTGQHDRDKDNSVIDYLKYLGIKVIDDYIDEDNNFYGHFMLHESKLEYGTGKCGIKDLTKYNYVFLGHQHNPQKLTDKIYHLGSCRYCNFNEVGDKNKQIAFIENNEIKFIPLKSPIKIVDVKTINELHDRDLEGYKVRLCISSFEQFKKEINLIQKIKNNYADFKVKLDFSDNLITSSDNKETKSLKSEEIIENYLKNIKDPEVKQLLENTKNVD